MSQSSMQPADCRDKIVVVDYHKGNISSVVRGIAAQGGDVVASDDPECIVRAKAVVLPGVGAFGDAMDFMNESGQAQAITEAIGRGVPFLGICLGLQLLLEWGSERSTDILTQAGKAPILARTKEPEEASISVCAEESEEAPIYVRAEESEEAPIYVHAEESAETNIPGLALCKGSATKLESSRLKIPHVGWDSIDLSEHGRRDPLLRGVAEGATLYFTHSYAADDDLEVDIIAARTHYGRSFASVVWKDNIHAVQFHPEKSSRTGGVILRNFVDICHTG